MVIKPGRCLMPGATEVRHPGWAFKNVAKAEVVRAKGIELTVALQRRQAPGG